MKTAIIDTETSALRDYNRVHCVVFRDVETDEVTRFRNVQPGDGELDEYLSSCDRIVGHNIYGFDYGVLEYLGVGRIPEIVDTLVLSRLLNYRIEGGHSLEAWGHRLGFPKDTFSDFSEWSQELEDRCVQDTLLTKALYNTFRVYLESPRWQNSIRLEHQVADICRILHKDGFKFDILEANKLFNKLTLEVNTLEETLKDAFPPKAELIKEFTPRLTQKGTYLVRDFSYLGDKEWRDLSWVVQGEPIKLYRWTAFNPLSNKQVVERLNEAGWKPTSKTKGHIAAERSRDQQKLQVLRQYGWRLDDENLDTLPETAPEGARKLVQYRLLSNRLSTLREWRNLYNAKSGAIHGTFNGIGSWSHRKSHTDPNMANIPALYNRKGNKQPYGAEFRSLFTASAGRVLVGTDADSIQFRIFAHYTADEKLIKSVSEGKKELKTDPHTLNLQIMHPICNSRESAKTMIYALLLGAQKRKVSEILQCSLAEAEEAMRKLLEAYPGWKILNETIIPKDAARGYFEGLDGRIVFLPDERRVLAGYLQNGESVIMKMANVRWRRELTRMGIPFTQVNDVHDEWQTECLPEHADLVGRIQCASLVLTGEELGLKCPLAGSTKVGLNWNQTH